MGLLGLESVHLLLPVQLDAEELSVTTTVTVSVSVLVTARRRVGVGVGVGVAVIQERDLGLLIWICIWLWFECSVDSHGEEGLDRIGGCSSTGRLPLVLVRCGVLGGAQVQAPGLNQVAVP